MYKILIKRVAAELDRNKIPYMIIGGQAVLLYGEPRLTKDIDITLGVGIEELPVVKKSVRALRLSIESDNIDDFVRNTMVLPAKEDETGIRVDFVFTFSPFERLAIERAREVIFDGTPVRFASLEDIVILKIVAGRPRDIEDVRTILLKNSGFDRRYIRSWLEEFDKALDEKCSRRFEDILADIARISGKRLARLGGTAKNLQPIPRRKSRS
jgi:predicted nucleotidyltransferase